MARKKAEAETELQFEEAMKRLESVVATLEQGEIPLEEAILLYQEGVQLSKLCASKLERIEAQITQLLEDGGKVVERAFRLEEEE